MVDGVGLSDSEPIGSDKRPSDFPQETSMSVSPGNVPRISEECSRNVLGTFLVLGTFPERSWNILGTFLECSERSWNVPGMFLECSENVLGVFLECSGRSRNVPPLGGGLRVYGTCSNRSWMQNLVPSSLAIHTHFDSSQARGFNMTRPMGRSQTRQRLSVGHSTHTHVSASAVASCTVRDPSRTVEPTW